MGVTAFTVLPVVVRTWAFVLLMPVLLEPLLFQPLVLRTTFRWVWEVAEPDGVQVVG